MFFALVVCAASPILVVFFEACAALRHGFYHSFLYMQVIHSKIKH